MIVMVMMLFSKWMKGKQYEVKERAKKEGNVRLAGVLGHGKQEGLYERSRNLRRFGYKQMSRQKATSRDGNIGILCSNPSQTSISRLLFHESKYR